MAQEFPLSQATCGAGEGVDVIRARPCTSVGQQIADNFVRFAATKIFSDPDDSIGELVANAIDSYGYEPIGRFGLGFFSVFALLLASYRASQVRITTNKDRPKAVVVKKVEGVLRVEFDEAQRAKGTTVKITFLSQTEVDKFRLMISKFQHVKHVAITFNGEPVNPVQSERFVRVRVDKYEIEVEDGGKGMDMNDLLKLLVPSIGFKSVFKKRKVEASIVGHHQEVLQVCVNRVIINEVFLPGKGFKHTVFLPASAKLLLDRSEVLFSDADTFNDLMHGFKKLVDKRMAESEVLQIQELISNFVKKSKQPEAFRFTEAINKHILESDFVLVPEKDAALFTACKSLGIACIRSKLYGATKLEDLLVAKAKKTRTTFTDKILVEIPTLESAVHVSPYLMRVALSRQKLTDAEIYKTCLVPYNGCTYKKLGAVNEIISELFDKMVDSVDYSFRCLNTQILTKHRAACETLLALWDYKITPKGGEPNDVIDNFFKLWASYKLPDRFLEACNLFRTKIIEARDVTASYSSLFSNLSVKWVQTSPLVNHFKGATKPRLRKITQSNFWTKNPTIADLEVELIFFKISVFPQVLRTGASLFMFTSPLEDSVTVERFEMNSFRDVSLLIVEYVPQDRLDANFLVSLIQKKTSHVVETFIAYMLFALYVKHHDLSKKFDVHTCLTRILAQLRLNVSLKTMLRLYADDLTGTPHDQEIFFRTVLQPVVVSFPFLQTSHTKLKALPLLGAPTKFSVNDAIVFMRTQKHLGSFLETVPALAVFAETNGGKCNVSAVQIASNLRSEKTDAINILCQLFALANLRVKIDFALEGVDFYSDADIDLLPLVIPFYHESAEFFSLFRMCETLTITTHLGRLVFTPKIELNAVVDVNVSFFAGASKGTHVRLVFKNDVDRTVFASQLKYECVSKFCFGKPITVDQVLVKRETTPFIQTYELSVFKMVDSELVTASVVYVEDAYYSTLEELWLTLFGTACADNDEQEDVLTPCFNFGAVVKFPNLYFPLQALKKAQFRMLVHNYITGPQKFANYFVPHTTAETYDNQIIPHAGKTNLERIRSNWFPETKNELRIVIASIAHELFKLPEEKRGIGAQKIVASMFLDDKLAEQALLKWFGNKDGWKGSIEETDDNWPPKPDLPSSPVLQALANAILISLNGALERGLLIQFNNGKKLVTVTPKSKVEVVVDFQMAKDIPGSYMPPYERIEVNASLHAAAENLYKKLDRSQNRATLFDLQTQLLESRLMNKSFKNSTMVHEMLHHFVPGGFAYHPEILISSQPMQYVDACLFLVDVLIENEVTKHFNEELLKMERHS